MRIAQVVDVQVRLQTTMVASSEVMKVNRILYIWHNRKLLEAWNFEWIVATSPEFNPNKVHESLINHPKINPPIFQGLEKRLSFEFCIETLSMFFFGWGKFFPRTPQMSQWNHEIGWWLEAPNVVSSGSSVFATLKTPSSTRGWRWRCFGSFGH